VAIPLSFCLNKKTFMLSYWEQTALLEYDNIIIGSGIVGLCTAIALKEAYPEQRVLILERSLLPYGASTRNAGFACMGSFTEICSDLQHQTPEEVLQLFLWRREGLQLLRNLLTDKAIGYEDKNSYELISEQELPQLQDLDKINQWIAEAIGTVPFAMANDKITAFGFNTQFTKALIENTQEGSIHTGYMMRVLIDKAIQKGVEIKTGATVTTFHREANKVNVIMEDAYRKALALSTKRLIICTNAFTHKLLPHEDVYPGRGQVLLTEPIANLPFKGIFHFDEGYYYFRSVGNRILFGGGRNIDFNKETTINIDLNNEIQNVLIEKLQTIILPNHNFKIAQQWSGIMAFGKSKMPIIKEVDPNIFAAFRMGGMGVALAAKVAQEVVTLIKQGQ
jgi:gamma-glutamylputrescine oxidase